MVGQKNKIIAIILVFLLINIIQTPQNKAENIAEKTIDLLDRLKNKTEYNYIEADNSYEYGLKAGKMFYPHFRLFKILQKFSYEEKTKSTKECAAELSKIQEQTPEFYEQLRGFSDGVKINIDELFKIFGYIWGNLIKIENHCTTTLSTGKATADNETFLTQNIDTGIEGFASTLFYFIIRSMTLKPWICNLKSTNYQYIFFGIPIIYEFFWLNEAGLAWGANGLTLTNDENITIDEGDGVATYILERKSMMTCRNVTEVADLWINTERASGSKRTWPHFWDNSISMWADKEGNILNIEQTHNHIITVYRDSTDITQAPEDIIWHANHHQWLNNTDTGSVTAEEDPFTGLRAERAKELLIENYGEITLDTCKSITRDYKGGFDKYSRDSADICRYSDQYSCSQTAISWIIQPKKKTVYYTIGPPDRYKYIKLDLSEIFKDKKTINIKQDQKQDWKVKYRDFLPLPWPYYIRDSCLIKKNTAEKLRTFFIGCETPRDFYERIQENINDYYIDENSQKEADLSMREKRIDVIVDKVIQGNCTLYSFQQSLFLIAGIKAMFSTYDESEKKFILNEGLGDFKIEIWRNKCNLPPVLPYRSRIKIVVDQWNGTETFEYGEQVEKIEIDTYQNNYREFTKYNDFILNPLMPAKLNSIISTD